MLYSNGFNHIFFYENRYKQLCIVWTSKQSPVSEMFDKKEPVRSREFERNKYSFRNPRIFYTQFTTIDPNLTCVTFNDFGTLTKLLPMVTYIWQMSTKFSKIRGSFINFLIF